MNIEDIFEPSEIARRARAEAMQCDHASQEIRFVTQSNGNILYKKQCLRCGQLFLNLAHDELSEADKQGAKPTDGTIRKRFQQQGDGIFEAAFNKAKAERKEGRRRRYARYLESEKWQRKRDLVLKRANGICEGCLENRATQVHHLSYNSIFDELLFHLVAVCDPCHVKIHPQLEDLFDNEIYAPWFEAFDDD